jgi:hypothetical protein
MKRQVLFVHGGGEGAYDTEKPLRRGDGEARFEGGMVHLHCRTRT